VGSATPRGAINRFSSHWGVFWRKLDGRYGKLRLGNGRQSRDPRRPPKTPPRTGPQTAMFWTRNKVCKKKWDDARPPGRAVPFPRPARPISATARNFRPRCWSAFSTKRLDRDVDQKFGLFSWGSRGLGGGVPGLEGVGGHRNFGCSTASLNLGRLHQASDGRLVSRKNKIVQND
jgi:hypothetical protein